MNNEENIRKLKQAVQDAKHIVFFSGAGMSTASGIPDFRSSTGLYKNVYRAEEMISHSFYKAYPADFFTFYRDKLVYEDAKPNSGHLFIAELEKTKDVAVVTQNIDGLHQMAGSTNVYELHGSIHRNYCEKCHRFYPLSKIMETDGVPYCECGGIIKPDVVLYEEGLDEQTIEGAVDAIMKADLLVVLGTSLNVYPAAGFLRYFRGDTMAIINRDATPYDSHCDIVIHDDINKVFKQIEEV